MDTWAHLVSDVSNEAAKTPVKINQDANIFATQLSADAGRPLPLASGRQAYLQCMEGAAAVALGAETVRLVQHDALRVRAGAADALLVTAGEEGAHVLVVEMAAA